MLRTCIVWRYDLNDFAAQLRVESDAAFPLSFLKISVFLCTYTRRQCRYAQTDVASLTVLVLGLADKIPRSYLHHGCSREPPP